MYAEITARSNDTHYAYVFATLLKDKAKSGDVFIGVSGSGSSNNTLKTIKQAKQLHITSIAITKKGSPAITQSDLTIGKPKGSLFHNGIIPNGFSSRLVLLEKLLGDPKPILLISPIPKLIIVFLT